MQVGRPGDHHVPGSSHPARVLTFQLPDHYLTRAAEEEYDEVKSQTGGGGSTHPYVPITRSHESGPAANDDTNDLRAKGHVCRRCRTVIGANEPVHQLPKGGYVHEICPTSSQC